MKVTVQSNKVFRPVHKSKCRYVIMKGSAGSGKSVDTAQQYILRLMNNKGRNLLCLRKSEVTNRDSTFAELISAINRIGVSNYWKAVLNPLSLKCINGNKIIFRGMNDDKQREKIKSITFENGKLTDVWLEEMTEFTQSDFEIIDDRLRGELPDGLFYQIKGTFNPVNSQHWIKKVFFDISDPNVLTHHSTYIDNRFVDEAYKARMMRRKIVDPEGYRIYGLGEWGEIGGLILNNFIIHEFDTDLTRFDDNYLGQDFGYNHANAIYNVSYKDDEIYIFNETYMYEKDTSEIIESVQGKYDKTLEMFCDSAEPDRINMWKKAGYRAKPVKKEKNSVNAQIDFLKGHKIHIHPSCIWAIKEVQQWKWKKDEKLGIYIDEPVAFFDDAMAAIRYGIERLRKYKSIEILR